MALLIPLVLVTGLVRLTTWGLLSRGVTRARPWASWPGAAGAGLAAVLLFASVTHFVEPQRSGLVAIVPEFVPFPDLVVTATGIAEVTLAAGLVVPRTRRWAAWGAVLLLVAMFPANIVAAAGVDNPAAPSTPLLPRAMLQVVFIASGIVAALPAHRLTVRRTERSAA